ncbi:hypothetical protein SISNIDRAFT_467431 [Sistotremastrum niveocremeum HHB9708]|uniref:F-box domain-containing protein n=1 Tax=Sistotremastrum niveocremeum HHB9708 TaxID=1314777 RepID=A0A164SVF2_9AGAM|nr:hypothetical protein SISNIDRAFT_467431 [Sistotremastrum niveocremeum HHB9708]
MAVPQTTQQDCTIDAESSEKSEADLKSVAAQIEEKISSLTFLVTEPSDLTQSVAKQEQLSNALEALQHAKTKCESTLNSRIVRLWRHSNQRRPISRLPNELLVEILQYAAIALSEQDVEDVLHPYGAASSSKESYSFKYLVNLTHVCFHWRHVAINMPCLWRYISMAWPLSVSEVFRTRCADALFRVTLDDRITSYHFNKKSFLDSILLRTSTLQARFPAFDPSHDQASIAKQLLSHALPNMQTLVIFCPRRQTTVMPDMLFQEVADKLRSLSLFHVAGALSHRVFSGLRTLRIHYASHPANPEQTLSLSAIFLLLQQTPNLEIFQFSRDVDDSTMDLRHSQTSFKVDKLRTVILGGWEGTAADIFFSIVDMPGITELKVSVVSPPGPLEEAFDPLSYLHRVSHNIREFLSSGRHLAMHLEQDCIVYSLSFDDASPTHSPRAIFMGVPASEIFDEMFEEQFEYPTLALGLAATLLALQHYFVLPQVVTFVYKVDFSDNALPPSPESWRECLKHFTSLQELEITGLGTSKSLLTALTPSVEDEEDPVLCPTLRTVKLPQPESEDDGIVHSMFRRRRLRGCKVEHLIFVCPNRDGRHCQWLSEIAEADLWLYEPPSEEDFVKQHAFVAKEVGTITRLVQNYSPDDFVTGRHRHTLKDEETIY